MNRFFSVLTRASLCLLAATPALLHGQTTGGLTVSTAVEIEYPTEVGHRYTLQGAVSLTNWTDIGRTVLGTGRPVKQTFSTRGGEAVAFTAYRLRVTDGPTNGYAPWSVAGVKVRMDDQSAGPEVEYTDDRSGRDVYGAAADSFSYEYARLGANDARVERTFTADRREVVSYSYTGPGVGTWLREEYRSGVMERRVLGVFRYLDGGTNGIPGATNPPVVITTPQPPAPPLTLTGLVYYVQSGSTPDQLHFQNDRSGIETPTIVNGAENEIEVSPGGNAFTYTYTVLGANTASLVVNFGYYGFGGDKNEYDLTYTDGGSGTFVRRIYRLGALYSTDTGAFSPFAPAANPGAPPVVDPGVPPVSPVGLTYTVLGGNVPERLVFKTSITGIDFDDSAPTDFGYSYTATGAGTFSLVVRFKADRWDEYDLTFNGGVQGTYVRRQFKNGKFNRTNSGSFTVAPTGN